MGSGTGQMFEGGSLEVSFACPIPHCEGVIDRAVEDATFDWAHDNISDGLGQAETDLNCPDCGELLTVQVLGTAGGRQVSVLGHPQVRIEYPDDTDYDDFLFEYYPVDPVKVFDTALEDIDTIYQGSDTMPGVGNSFRRMIYLNYVIALEAYLSDRLIKIITNDRKKLVALVQKDTELNKIKYTLADLAVDPDFILNTVKKHLQTMSFHNLPKVDALYKAVLSVSLFEDDKHRAEMIAVIERRHHLVHRNGRDNDGAPFAIEEEDVLRVRALATSMVKRIELEFNDYDVRRAFVAATFDF